MRRVALVLLLAACGGEEEGSDPSTDVGDDTAPTSDAEPTSDTSHDPNGTPTPDAGADAASDAPPSGDASEDPGPPCEDPAPSCVECGLDFTGEDIDRPSVRVGIIANEAGVMRVRDVWMEGTPPLLQLSNSWIDYIDRVAPDWVPNETLTGFDTVGSLISIHAGERFEVEVLFNEIFDGPTGCSDGDCGTVVVEYELCNGSAGTETIEIRRR